MDRATKPKLPPYTQLGLVKIKNSNRSLAKGEMMCDINSGQFPIQLTVQVTSTWAPS